MLLIDNIRIIDPASNTDMIGSILHDGQIIHAIIPAGEMSSERIPEGTEYMDGTGLIAVPGLVDIHVHFRDPGFTYKEDINTGAAAARAGGYTSVVMMANTKPVIDNVEILSDVLTRGRDTGTGVHIYSAAAITRGFKGQELTDMEGLLKAGAVGFTDDGIPILSEDTARAAMEESARLGCVLSFHEEDPAYIENNGINHGKASDALGIGGSDRQAEISMVERDIRLAKETGARIHIQHISAKETVELIRLGKADGVKVTAEATPHHIALTEDAVLIHGSLAKMNPPLRTEEDRMAIIEGLRDGTIDVIATDHAPHSSEEKSKPITQAPSGIIGLQSALAVCIHHLVKPGYLSMMELIRLMSTNPAALYDLPAGRLYEGGPADICIFDPDADYRLPENAILSRSANTPFLCDTV